MSYQSHNNQNRGDSESSKKLALLGIPSNLAGMSFLDMGCNEGYFCGEALRRSASRVIGIDRDEKAISVAKKMYPNIEFSCQDWLEVDEVGIDIILLSSALHYAENPLMVLTRVWQSLAPNGLFVLEAGAIEDEGSNLQSMRIGRSAGSCIFPTESALEKMLRKSGFLARKIGKSINQSGDPVSRWVWHCRKERVHVILVTGDSGSGKSTLSNSIRNTGSVDVVSTDSLIGHLFKSDLQIFMANQNDALKKDVEMIYQNLLNNGAISPWENIDAIAKEFVRLGRAPEIVDLVISQLTFSVASTVLIEGYLLSFAEIYYLLAEKLQERGLLISQLRTGVGFNFNKFQQELLPNVDEDVNI